MDRATAFDWSMSSTLYIETAGANAGVIALNGYNESGELLGSIDIGISSTSVFFSLNPCTGLDPKESEANFTCGNIWRISQYMNSYQQTFWDFRCNDTSVLTYQLDEACQIAWGNVVRLVFSPDSDTASIAYGSIISK